MKIILKSSFRESSLEKEIGISCSCIFWFFSIEKKKAIISSDFPESFISSKTYIKSYCLLSSNNLWILLKNFKINPLIFEERPMKSPKTAFEANLNEDKTQGLLSR